ncbi:hypothetical protein [[Clostridium] polysaccharolyticum]|nr:hypothetical protein [[Clostridium] polysaccharolyticum]
MKKMKDVVNKVLKAVAVGTSIGTLVCLGLDALKPKEAVMLLALGVASLSISSLSKEEQ